MAHIFITGRRGTVASIIAPELSRRHVVSGIDLPDDLATTADLATRLAGVETVIHLARERSAPTRTDPDNVRIAPSNVAIDLNVMASIIEAKVRRLILASSVHADDFRGARAPRPITVPGSYKPATPYGTYKLIEEEIAKLLASRYGFELVIIRLGGVTADGSVKAGPDRTATWLSHNDLQEAFAAAISNPPVPGRSSVFYAVSANADRVHDTSNPFGWLPKDDSSAFDVA